MLKGIAIKKSSFRPAAARAAPHISFYDILLKFQPEPVFVNVYGAQESIPKNRFRQPMQPDRPVRQIELSYRSARLEIDSWAPSKVYKYELRNGAIYKINFPGGIGGFPAD